MNDNLGDRMKAYEAAETERRLMTLLPVYARIDGRCFSAFTRGMERPFDERLSRAMISTTTTLVERTHARIGYTQSDEISLAWLSEAPKTEMLFSGKIQKMVSVLAGLATAAFMRSLTDNGLGAFMDRFPHFDARVFSLPNRTEVANAFLWRELDATKNAVSMAARSAYSHKALQGKSSSEMQEMLFQKGINFNDYPAFFKRGTFVRRETVERTMSASERLAIPDRHRPAEDATFLRSEVREIDMPRFSKVLNREAVIFDGATPIAVPQMQAVA